MKASELQKFIQQEVTKIVRTEMTKIIKSELPKMVKPMVQEAVAGALAGLLAEGIVNGPPASKSRILTPDIPQVKKSNLSDDRPAKKAPTFNRQSMAEQLGYGTIEPIGPKPEPTGDITTDILAETQYNMLVNTSVDSVLDVTDHMKNVIAPETVDAITRDYSSLMKKMDERGMLRG